MSEHEQQPDANKPLPAAEEQVEDLDAPESGTEGVAGGAEAAKEPVSGPSQVKPLWKWRKLTADGRLDE